MSDKKRKDRVKSKTIQVKSRALFGKSEMDKAIKQYTDDGWELVSQEETNKAGIYKLHFEKAHKEAGCWRWIRYAGFTTLFCCISSVGLSTWMEYDETTFGPTRTIVAQTESVFETRTAIFDATENAPTYNAQTATARVWTRTPTPLPTNTPRPTRTTNPANVDTTTYYIRGSGANFRLETNSSSLIVGSASFGDHVQVVRAVEGENVLGSNEWYEIVANGNIAYVHSSLLSRTRPPTVVPPPPATRVYNCNCSRTCGSMTCQEAYFQLNQCGCTQRDGDSDGIPCEQQCGN